MEGNMMMMMPWKKIIEKAEDTQFWANGYYSTELPFDEDKDRHSVLMAMPWWR